MRVLYLLYHPDALSESYMRTEIEWMQRAGVQIHVLAAEPHISTYPNTVTDVVYRERLAEAVARVKPDVIHVHWLYALTWIFGKELGEVEVPVTIRGHSFDFSPERVAEVLAMPNVQRLWLFPHLAAQIEHRAVRPLPSCYEPRIFFPGVPARPPRVVRTLAGVPRKGLEDLLEIARRTPEVPFTVAMTRALPPHHEYPEAIRNAAPANVEVLVNAPREKVADVMRRSAIYLMNKPNHAFGMPASMAEAMGSGLFLVSPDVPGAREYVGEAGEFYRDGDVDGAVSIIRRAASFTEDEWAAARDRSLERADHFRADAVLPEILEDWRFLVGHA